MPAGLPRASELLNYTRNREQDRSIPPYRAQPFLGRLPTLADISAATTSTCWPPSSAPRPLAPHCARAGDGIAATESSEIRGMLWRVTGPNAAADRRAGAHCVVERGLRFRVRGRDRLGRDRSAQSGPDSHGCRPAEFERSLCILASHSFQSSLNPVAGSSSSPNSESPLMSAWLLLFVEDRLSRDFRINILRCTSSSSILSRSLAFLRQPESL